MNLTIAKSAGLGTASILGAFVLAAPALADGLPSRGRIAAPPGASLCTFSGNVGVTTDYVFRGFSQTLEDPAVQGGVDASCGRFYVGFWGSNVDFGDGETNVETDVYAGFKTATGPISWDLGVIYYGYPGGASNADYFEIKVGASGEIWKGGTLGGTVFYSPEYTLDSGSVWTVEGSFSQALPKVGIFSPTFSALVGHSSGGDDFETNFLVGLDDNYTYWNAGLALGFFEKWSLDLRYWDTNAEEVLAIPGDSIADERFVATLKYAF